MGKHFVAGVLSIIFVVIPHAAATSQPAKLPTARCQLIHDSAELNNIRNDLAGSYCLADDIDASSAHNFVPIGYASPGGNFSGVLDGRGHTIRNLTINSTVKHDDGQYVGLFSMVSGTIRRLGLINERVHSSTYTSAIGGIVGYLWLSGAISDSFVSGTIVCEAPLGGCTGGGIAGALMGDAVITRSWSSASVADPLGGTFGGAVGQMGGGAIKDSYTTGAVTSGEVSELGGLVGIVTDGGITNSFASGPVRGGAGSVAGGLIGENWGAISRSYATGPVQTGDTTASGYGTAGGLIGRSFSPSSLKQTYAAGRVSGSPEATLGGLVGKELSTSVMRSSYWDWKTTSQTVSAGGVAQPTARIQSAPPRGFDASWAVTVGQSFPYLKAFDGSFASPLATITKQDVIYTFLPISQLEPMEYTDSPAHADEASLATVFTMVARAMGVSRDLPQFERMKVDRYFWDDAAQTSTWRGPITRYATKGAFISLSAEGPIDDTNIIGEIRARRLVAIEGTYTTNGGQTATHWMLATLFAENGTVITALVANDPWTGRQVRIDPVTKQVTTPGFPLAGFTVHGYSTISLKPG